MLPLTFQVDNEFTLEIIERHATFKYC